MALNLSRLACIGILSSLVTAQALTKPLIQPSIPSLDPGLLNNLHPTQSTHDQWGAGWIPQDCYDTATSKGLNPADFEVFNIHYTDCPAVWIFCRHVSAPLSQIDMIDLFGRLPVNMRSFVRHVIAIPGGQGAGSNGDNIAISGTGNQISLFAHETGHSLDGHAYTSYIGNGYFHESSIWLDNYNMDSAVSDGYAQTNQAENHSQEVVIALFDRNVPGGIGTVEPNWNAIYHQYQTVRGYLGNVLVPGGTCSGRLANSAPVPSGSTARSLKGGPDVSLPPGLKVYAPRAKAAHFDIRNSKGDIIG